tara:strand:- start:1681 stop:1836 length:156 start_codon:yes stop_codon:yes gene_type:complete
MIKRKRFCGVCEKEIINVAGKPIRTRYCTPNCAEVAMKKYQAFYRKIYVTL